MCRRFQFLFKTLVFLPFLILVFGFVSFSSAQTTKKVPLKAEDAKPLLKGDRVPSVTLKTVEGAELNLLDAAKKQPTILLFYRGGWCIYCNRHFGELKKVESALQKLGYQILAISMDRVEKLKETKKKHKLTYQLLSDSQARAVKAFGLAFVLDDPTVELYKKRYGIDIEADSGETHHILPVPAAYVVDRSGLIQFVYSNPDYKVRIDPKELLKAAQEALDKGL